MLIETLLGAKEAISFGVSLYELTGKVRGIVTGNTVAHRVARIEAKLDTTLDRLAERVALADVGEVSAHRGTAHRASVTQEAVAGMRGVQGAMGLDLVQSRAIEAPDQLLQLFGENPERLLTNVSRLDGGGFDPALMSDPTMVPVVFEKWGTRFVGWSKEGALSLSLGVDYRPEIARRVGAGAGRPRQAPSPRPQQPPPKRSAAKQDPPFATLPRTPFSAERLKAKNVDAWYAHTRGLQMSEMGRIKEAYTWFKKAAAGGHAEAHAALGRMYEFGRGPSVNEYSARTHYGEAVRLGLALVEADYGKLLIRLARSDAETRAGIERLEAAIARDETDAMVTLALAHRDGAGLLEADTAKAIPYLKMAADRGKPFAMYLLACYLSTGTGVEKDIDQAMQLHHFAADQGYKFAQFQLGVIYSNSDLVPRDRKRSAHYFELSARQGVKESQYWFGWCLEHGHGVAQDQDRARAHYRAAAKNGDTAAAKRLKELGEG